jgi:hypothetical protein
VGEGLPLRLPGWERARVAPAKLSGYLLDPAAGGQKAHDLARFLGYGPADAERLHAELLAVAGAFPVSAARPARHPPGGQRYTVDGVMSGPNGEQARVRTGWQVDAPGGDPYLVTAFLRGRLRAEG